MNAKPALARYLAAPAALALAVLAIAAEATPAAAQYWRNYPSPYGRGYQYDPDDDDYDRPRQPQRVERDWKRDPNVPRTGPIPLMSVVSLSDQHVTVYDGNGHKMFQSPVSTGATGLETPAGIYSVVQKREFHQSNVYQDGNMPFMQRITWTGIALHAGVLPGYPASHGCIRMPMDFAQRLFGLTDIGMRVIVVRDDIRPGAISHPVLFKPQPLRREASLAGPSIASDSAQPTRVSAPDGEATPPPGSPKFLEFLKARAAARSTEAEAATKRATAARQAAAKKAAEAGPASKTLSAAEANRARAQEALQKAEQALAAASASAPLPDNAAQTDADKEKAEAESRKAAAKLAEMQAAKAKAATKLAEAEAQLEKATALARAKMKAAEQAGKDVKLAEAAREAAVEASEEASRQTSPVSVFISRKTQRLYIRKGYQPTFEAPVTIRDADRPIGSYVFTALDYASEGLEPRWIVVSMYKAGGASEVPAAAKRRQSEHRHAEAAPADVAGAKAALDRIVIAQDVRERISRVVLPGSSLIVSDEGANIETGKDTDFVVLMSGEPQGGLKTRRREQPRYRSDNSFGGGSKGGGGCFFLFGC